MSIIKVDTLEESAVVSIAHKFIGGIENYRDKPSQSNNNQKISNRLKKKSNNKHQNKPENLIKK
jgi:hypothetical protein